MAMPALQALASMTDSGKIDMCLNEDWDDYRKKSIKEILRSWEIVEQIIIYPSVDIDFNKYDLFFFSPFGEKDELAGIFMNRLKERNIKSPNWMGTGVHESDYYMQIARVQGYTGSAPKVKFPVADEPKLELKRPIIGVCNGYYKGKEYWAKKSWPYFAEFCEVAGLYFGGSVVAVGLEGEIPRNDFVTVDYCGKLSMTETAKVLSQLDLFVVNDTGLLFVADMIGTPTIALFGPTLVTKVRPKGRNTVVLQSNVDCVECMYTQRFETCPEAKCMASIKVGDVMSKAREMLRDFI